MYALWTKLTSIEEVLLLGTPDEVVDYLQQNFTNPTQQIHAMFSERTEQLKRNSCQEIPNNALSCRIIHHDEISFDETCDYIAFVVYSHNGKNAFIYNGQQYKRGDIIIKNIKDIPNSSSVLKSGLRNPQIYQNLYELFFACYFKKPLDKHFVGLGIIYEKYKWKFDTFIFGSESKRSSFSIDEQHLIEMSILTWTKNMYDSTTIRDNARKMLDEQLNYVKDLLETQRPEMENIWLAEQIDLTIKVFEYEVQDEIAELFQIRSIFNTFNNLRDQIQSKDDKKLSLIADIFEHRRLTLITQSSEPFLCQIWKQLKTVEDYLRKDDFNSLVNFLRLNTFISIETLYSISLPLFLHQLGIYSESDSFDSTLTYIGLLIYQYNNQEEFLLNQHHCKRGQILIRQKENIIVSAPTSSYKKTSFNPLFIHEYLYESYFNQKPNEFFQGIGFIYEQGKWKFDVLTYAGKDGIHSTYDTRGDNQMSSNINEQHSLDLILSTIYMNNKWKDELGLMYDIDELESIGRDLFRKEINSIENLFETKKDQLKKFDNTCHLDLKYFIQQYKPNVKPFVTNKPKLTKSLSSLISGRSLDSFDGNQTLINSDKDCDLKKTSKTHPSVDSLTTNDSQNQLTSNSLNSTTSTKPKKRPGPPKPIIFCNFPGLGRKRSTSCELLSTPESVDHNENPSPVHLKSHRSDSISQKSREPISLYQLWRELCFVEQILLHKSDLNEFLKYLADQQYKTSNESNRYVLPPDESDAYNLMAKIKIDSQFDYIKELFQLKKSKLFSEQTNQDKKKQLEDLFKIFEKYYHKQIDIGKKYWKLNILCK